MKLDQKGFSLLSASVLFAVSSALILVTARAVRTSVQKHVEMNQSMAFSSLERPLMLQVAKVLSDYANKNEVGSQKSYCENSTDTSKIQGLLRSIRIGPGYTAKLVETNTPPLALKTSSGLKASKSRCVLVRNNGKPPEIIAPLSTDTGKGANSFRFCLVVDGPFEKKPALRYNLIEIRANYFELSDGLYPKARETSPHGHEEDQAYGKREFKDCSTFRRSSGHGVILYYRAYWSSNEVGDALNEKQGIFFTPKL